MNSPLRPSPTDIIHSYSDREEVSLASQPLIPVVDELNRMWATKSELDFPQSTRKKAGSLMTYIRKPVLVLLITPVSLACCYFPWILTNSITDDDYAVAKLAAYLHKTTDAEFFMKRALSAPFSIFNNETGFMEAKFANGSWAGSDVGWTEGDDWAYTFDVVHDVEGLIKALGGNEKFVQFLDEHFNGGALTCSMSRTVLMGSLQDTTTIPTRFVMTYS